MFKWLYLITGLALFFKILFVPHEVTATANISAVELLVEDSGIPNVVSAIILRNRLYDTIFEVVVFSIAILGCAFLLANEKPVIKIRQFTDKPSIILARLGATISALVCIELALRGHLSPGGGFASGVAGGTAIGLVAITSSSEWMQSLYQKWRAAELEKMSVLIFIVLSIVTLIGFEFPMGEMGSLLSGGVVPILNILVALKVTLSSWAVILIFIRYRGLL